MVGFRSGRRFLTKFLAFTSDLKDPDKPQAIILDKRVRDAWRALTNTKPIADDFSVQRYVEFCQEVATAAADAGLGPEAVEKALFFFGQRFPYEEWLRCELRVMRRLAGRSATAEEILQEAFDSESG